MIKSSTLKYLNVPTWFRWFIYIFTAMFSVTLIAELISELGYVDIPEWVVQTNDFAWPLWTFMIGYELGVRGVIRKLRKRFSL